MNNYHIHLILCSLHNTIKDLDYDYRNNSLLFDYKYVYRKLKKEIKEAHKNV